MKWPSVSGSGGTSAEARISRGRLIGHRLGEGFRSASSAVAGYCGRSSRDNPPEEYDVGGVIDLPLMAMRSAVLRLVKGRWSESAGVALVLALALAGSVAEAYPSHHYAGLHLRTHPNPVAFALVAAWASVVCLRSSGGFNVNDEHARCRLPRTAVTHVPDRPGGGLDE